MDKELEPYIIKKLSGKYFVFKTGTKEIVPRKCDHCRFNGVSCNACQSVDKDGCGAYSHIGK